MPELPEVETIKRQLSTLILNKKIINIKKSDLKLRKNTVPDLDSLLGQYFIDIKRRNKYLILELQSDFLVIHLGMTGQLIFSDIYPEGKHIHLILSLGQNYLYYQDIRRFGNIELFSTQEYADYLSIPIFSKLGFEPLEPEFSLQAFEKQLISSKLPAKTFLMDAQFVCGIGNIYANEILFLSKINPLMPINKINNTQKISLFNNIIEVLKKAIELGGSSISDFVHLNGSSGKMQNFYMVYGREGKLCKVCNTPILRLKQSGRSTFYCPYCQK